MLEPLPRTFAPTRDSIQRVVVHVVARRRHELSGRFGLRPGAASLQSPLAGPNDEVVRITPAGLVVERRGDGGWFGSTMAWSGSTLGSAATFVTVDLDAPFSVGDDTPPVGDRAVALDVDPVSVSCLVDWYMFGQRVLDRVLADVGDRSPTVAQVWPEHFDLGCDVAGGSSRVNLGASPGDGTHADPYLYLGPWGPERPGDSAYWNAPFGAVLGYEDLRRSSEPVTTATDFFVAGLDRFPAG